MGRFLTVHITATLILVDSIFNLSFLSCPLPPVRVMIITLHSVLVRQCLENCVQFWSLQFKTDTRRLGKVFTRSHMEKARGNGYKLHQERFHLGIRKTVDTVRTITPILDCDSKASLDHLFRTVEDLCRETFCLSVFSSAWEIPPPGPSP